MPELNIQFVGICTHIRFDQLVIPPGAQNVVGHRIVLVNGNPGAIAKNVHLKDAHPPIPGHYAILGVPASSRIAGPAASLFYPFANDLVLNLNIVGMNPLSLHAEAPPPFGLRGATLQVLGGFGGTALGEDTAHCLPNLSATVPDVTPGPAVTNQDPWTASAYFDVVVGTVFGRAETFEAGAQAFAEMSVTTVGAPQIVILPWDGDAPTLVTLPEDDPRAVVRNAPFTGGIEASDNHFLLHFVATNDQFPTTNALNIVTSCPGGHISNGAEGGPGCSNSNLP